MKPLRIIKRYIFFLCGLVIMALGTSVLTIANAGTCPAAAIAYVLSNRLAPSYGTFIFLVDIVLVLGQALILRRSFRLVSLFQLLASFVISACVDLWMLLLARITISGLLAQIVTICIGCVVLAAGVALQVAPNVIMLPCESFQTAIVQRYGKPFHRVKIVFDVTVVVIAAVLSLLFFKRLWGVGYGTVVAAILPGILVKPLLPAIQKLFFKDAAPDA